MLEEPELRRDAIFTLCDYIDRKYHFKTVRDEDKSRSKNSVSPLFVYDGDLEGRWILDGASTSIATRFCVLNATPSRHMH